MSLSESQIKKSIINSKISYALNMELYKLTIDLNRKINYYVPKTNGTKAALKHVLKSNENISMDTNINKGTIEARKASHRARLIAKEINDNLHNYESMIINN